MSGKAKHPQFTALFNRQGPLYGLTNGFMWPDLTVFEMMVLIAEHCYRNPVTLIAGTKHLKCFETTSSGTTL